MECRDENVSAEQRWDTERAFEALDVSELKLDLDKCEVSASEQQFTQEHASATVSGKKSDYVCNSLTICCIHSMKKVFESNRPKANFRSSARLMSNGCSVNSILHSTRSLLEDYCLMSQCRNSVYCSQVPCPPAVVTCNNCGKHFIGIGNRVLKLSNHIESKHRLEADILLLDMIRRYSALLTRMRKFLHMDQNFIAAHFD